jgi:hypothetical protein
VSVPMLSRLRRSPWLAGTLLLVLAAALVAPLVLWVRSRFSGPGSQRWPYFAAGLLALALLLFGAVERLWHTLLGLHLRRASARSRKRGFLRVVPGGKADKGNGHARDVDEDGEGPRWVM